MVEKTLSADRVTRDEAAKQLRALADELEGDGSATVQTGNKAVELHPSEEIAYEIGVRERSSILRGQRETVTIKLDWKPPKVSEQSEGAEAEAE
ncbi:amphi-Trp domain-containing protein [Natronorubrum sp. JWXQ-INN-674]|uniref:Amphi-Trp domain-containing protein n=1 Tax=Natronorubrum halalkaliphilum TaxID=2691917 RepID=A0A6B0VNK5_9EURY|nr:amphi-Trp domain-containing protein [Natronorubrum halalkaliphilum]MXV62795.1 amphi-Trp domain-containing protein [Natronorubrum halalkaliphilum]